MLKNGEWIFRNKRRDYGEHYMNTSDYRDYLIACMTECAEKAMDMTKSDTERARYQGKYETYKFQVECFTDWINGQKEEEKKKQDNLFS